MRLHFGCSLCLLLLRTRRWTLPLRVIERLQRRKFTVVKDLCQGMSFAYCFLGVSLCLFLSLFSSPYQLLLQYRTRVRCSSVPVEEVARNHRALCAKRELEGIFRVCKSSTQAL